MSLRPSRAVRIRSVLRLVLFGLAVPCVYLGGACLAFTLRQRADNAAYASLRLPPAPVPDRRTRLMVFAPHCDDETLGCGGLIQQTVAAGGRAQAVVITNGDGFRTAVECATHSLQVEPGDYIRFADRRQEESYGALTDLGLDRSDVHFLGYPDGGLWTLWQSHWTTDRLFTSATTRCDHSPYPNTFHPGAPYCGHALIEDIKSSMRAFRPTLIAVTHPSEDHLDHVAASAFVTRALMELQAEPQDAVWARHTRLIHYLIHRGDWPLPQGMDARVPLGPPAAMAHLDTHWLSLPLTPEQTACKARSIDRYASQTAMMGQFLHSFARSTELYGEISNTALPIVPDGSIELTGSERGWRSVAPALLDPVRDDVLRDLNGGGDIRDLYACGDRDCLYVRLDCRRPISGRFNYSLHIRAFGLDDASSVCSAEFDLSPRSTTSRGDGVRVRVKDRSVEAAIPWSRVALARSAAPAQTFAIDVETTLPGVTVDRTGIRFLTLAASPQRP